MVFLSPAKTDSPTETRQKIKVGRWWSSEQGSGKERPSLAGRLLKKLKENLLWEAKKVGVGKNRKGIPASKGVPTRAAPPKPSTSC